MDILSSFYRSLFVGFIISLVFSCTKEKEYEIRYWKVYPDIFHIPPAYLRQTDDTLSHYRQIDTLEVIDGRKKYIGTDSISYAFYKYDSLIAYQSQFIEKGFPKEVDVEGNYYRFEKAAHYRLKLRDTIVVGYGIEIYPTDWNMSDMVIFVKGYGSVARFPYAGGGGNRWFLEKVDRVKGNTLQTTISMNMLGDSLLQGRVRTEDKRIPLLLSE